MASLIDPYETGNKLRRMQEDIHRVVASMRNMDDRTLWRFVKTLAYAASQHHDMGEVPFDAAAHFVISHHDRPNTVISASPPPAAGSR